MWGGFSASKLKPQLKMASQRFQISSNKKSAIMKQQKRDIAQLLSHAPPKEEEARIRTESLIREDNTIEAYEILKLSCELLVERLKLISSQKTCPADLVGTVQTMIWASGRVDIAEMNEIRKMFKSKYGKQFYEDAMNNVDGVLNERVFAKLSVQPPSAALVNAYLEKIAQEFDIDWSPPPSAKTPSNDLAQPMPAPSGYSIPAAQGSGYGAAHHIPIYAGDARLDTDNDGGAAAASTTSGLGMGSVAGGGGASAPGAYSMPGPPPGGKPNGSVPPPVVDADIYIPPSPTTAPGSGVQPRGLNGTTTNNNRNDDDDDDEDDDDLNDLKAKFAQLKK